MTPLPTFLSSSRTFVLAARAHPAKNTGRDTFCCLSIFTWFYTLRLCVGLWICFAVCVFSSALRVKRGRHPHPPLPEMERGGSDLWTKSRAECFLSLLFSALCVLAVSLSFIPTPSLSFHSTVQQNCRPQKK